MWKTVSDDENVSEGWAHAAIMKHRWAGIGWGDRWHHFVFSLYKFAGPSHTMTRPILWLYKSLFKGFIFLYFTNLSSPILPKCVGQSWAEFCPAGRRPVSRQKEERSGERELIAGAEGLRWFRLLRMVYDRLSSSSSSVTVDWSLPASFRLWTQRWNEAPMKTLKLIRSCSRSLAQMIT